MPRYSDQWSGNARPVIGLGHERRGGTSAYAQQQPANVWESSAQTYGTGSAYGSNQQQSWRVCFLVIEAPM
jgi:hypothetical protein